MISDMEKSERMDEKLIYLGGMAAGILIEYFFLVFNGYLKVDDDDMRTILGGAVVGCWFLSVAGLGVVFTRRAKRKKQRLI
jgi:hypothetical protein